MLQAGIVPGALPAVETDRKKIVARLEDAGWINRAVDRQGDQRGDQAVDHDVYTHPAQPDVRIVVLRRRVVTGAVARMIAKQAGWR